ncbi:MAG: nucleoside hydrolase, partial [Corynebacterium sp.]|nr:nucleoside hydrolase [Corynebacterium sp.]
LAMGNPNIELLGITTVGGNQTLDKVSHNALVVKEIAGHPEVPVYAGCDRPLVRPVEVAEAIHGSTGMDVEGVQLPEPSTALADAHAIDFIIDTIMSHEPGTITLVPTGPLTNIAMAARKEPRIVERVKEVVLMGGGYHEGNWSPVAEFNIKIDPEAAHIVFEEPWPVTMVGLDLTHQALATPEVEAEIKALGTPVSEFVVGLFGFFRKAYQANQGFDNPPVHDPCTIAYLIDPDIVQTRKAPVHVELAGALTTGMTVTDLREPADASCHTQVATTLDHAGFWRLVFDALENLG